MYSLVFFVWAIRDSRRFRFFPSKFSITDFRSLDSSFIIFFLLIYLLISSFLRLSENYFQIILNDYYNVTNRNLQLFVGEISNNATNIPMGHRLVLL